MRDFAQLFYQLDQTNKTNEKLAALVNYFQKAEPPDALWALALLCGRRPKRTVSSQKLREWAAEISGIPYWLFEESYHTVGDLAETIAKLLPATTIPFELSLSDCMRALASLNNANDEHKKQWISEQWKKGGETEVFVFNKLLTGGFRVGVSQKLVERALSQLLKLPQPVVAHRLTGNWLPNQTTWNKLLLDENLSDDLSKPYPFCLAHPLLAAPESLGNLSEWQAEYKWDGIRGQLIVRGGEWFLWSRGEELINNQFPELGVLVDILPNGTVLDGEILAWDANGIRPFQHLQGRLGRKNPSAKMQKTHPIKFLCYDVLELNEKDCRKFSMKERRNWLENILNNLQIPFIGLSPLIEANSWDELAAIRLAAREVLSEGIMLKYKNSSYSTGRKRGDWWKWKLDPYSVDAVMIYAMKGHGRRANLYTDYTFAVWNEQGELVPFTKAYSGLNDDEIKQVDAFVKQNTLERFGPVRSVKAELVFEIGFEGIQASKRHKSGIALRFPRILKWRIDKKAQDADHLKQLLDMLPKEPMAGKN